MKDCVNLYISINCGAPAAEGRRHNGRSDTVQSGLSRRVVKNLGFLVFEKPEKSKF